MQLRFVHEHHDWPVEVTRDADGWRVELPQGTVSMQAAPTPDGAWLVATTEGQRLCWVAAQGDEHHVFCEGRAWRLRLHDPDEQPEEVDPPGGPVLRSRMPGKVIAVLVKVGDSVTAGQPLLIMESMKMETEMAAGSAGVVGEISVAPGQIVGMGESLITVVPAEGGPTDAG